MCVCHPYGHCNNSSRFRIACHCIRVCVRLRVSSNMDQSINVQILYPSTEGHRSLFSSQSILPLLTHYHTWHILQFCPSISCPIAQHGCPKFWCFTSIIIWTTIFLFSPPSTLPYHNREFGGSFLYPPPTSSLFDTHYTWNNVSYIVTLPISMVDFQVSPPIWYPVHLHEKVPIDNRHLPSFVHHMISLSPPLLIMHIKLCLIALVIILGYPPLPLACVMIQLWGNNLMYGSTMYLMGSSHH